MTKKVARILLVLLMASYLILSISVVCSAASTDMPWEGPMEKLLQSFTGPVAKIVGTLAIVMTGLGLAFGEGGGGLRKGLQIVFGLSIAFTASSFFLSFFGFSGGVAF